MFQPQRQFSSRPLSSRSRSVTVCKEPISEAKEDATDPDHPQAESRAGHESDSDQFTSDEEEADSENEEQGQVGGVLMEESGQWADEFEPDEDEAPVRNWWGRYRYLCREMLAEWLGMLVLVIIGCAADCQVKISDSLAGEYSSMSWCWGFAVMAGICES
jgi:aquaglyceroporin related protein